MSGKLTVDDLFVAAGLLACGPVPWNQQCVERRPGVYAVVIDSEIVYIGCTKRQLAIRIREFYRHKYGDKRPHRGGQEVLKMPDRRFVYWCATENPPTAETKMLDVFKDDNGRLPRANRRRGDRLPSAPKLIR